MRIIAPTLFVLACLTACVAKAPGSSARGERVDPAWIDSWLVDVVSREGIPPPPAPSDPYLQPADVAAALDVLYGRKAASPGVYNKLGDELPKVANLLLQRWQNPSDRELVSEVYLEIVEHYRLPIVPAWVNERAAQESLRLFGDLLDFSPGVRTRLLTLVAKSQGLRLQVAVHPLMLKRLAAAPAHEYALWGAAISDFEEFPAEDRKLAYDAIIEAIRQMASAHGPRRDRLWVSSYLGNRIARKPSPDGARALAEYIRARTFKLEDLVWPLGVLDPAWPETQLAISAALSKDDHKLVLAALAILREHEELRGDHVTAVSELAKSFREDVRAAALAALPQGVEPPAPPGVFELPADTANTLRAMLPFDITGARRVRARPMIHSPWHDRGLAEEPRLGWLLADRTRFISDALDITNVDPASFEFTPVDFAAEIDARLLDNSGPSHSELFSRYRLGWIAAAGAEDLLRVLYCLAWERSRGEDSFPRASALYLHVLARFSSSEAMLGEMAEVLATQRYLQCVHCFALASDAEALEHAAGFRAYVGWLNPWRREIEYLEHIERIEADIALRRRSKVDATTDSLEYWLQRMPDLHVAQWGQPGGYGWAQDEREVLHGIASYGLAALLPLADRLDDTRLIRGCSFWRDFAAHRELVTVGDAAAMLIDAICRHFLGYQLDYRLWSPENRLALRDWLKRAATAAANQ